MTLLPYRRLTFHTYKTAASVALLLLRAVPPDGSRFPSDQRMELEYFSSVWEASFTIVPNINFGNKHYPLFARHSPFTPVYKGKLTETAEGTRIEIMVTPLLELLALGAVLLFLAGAVIYHSVLSGTPSLDCLIMLLAGAVILGWLIHNDVSSQNRRLGDFLHRTVLANPAA